MTNWSTATTGINFTYVINTLNEIYSAGDIALIGRPAGRTESPVQIGSLTGWSLVATGNNHTLSIRTNNSLWAWGSNIFGQSGTNNNTQYPSPFQVGTDTVWQTITAKASSTMAIRTNGTLWGWGNNAQGQLGTGNTITYSSPVQIGALSDWQSVSAGTFHTMAIKTNGTLWAWGNNANGGLGGGTFQIQTSSPIQIGALTRWQSVSAGNQYTMAIQTDGTLWGWGNNANGQCGTSNFTTVSSPVQIGSLTEWQSVVAGNSFTIAIRTNGTLWGWGNNVSGRAGLPVNNGNYSSPTQIGTLTNWQSVATGDSHSMAVKTDGTLWGWGNNFQGQLGTGVLNNSYFSPVQIGTLTDWQRLSAGIAYTMAIKTDGTLWGWGTNQDDRLGAFQLNNRVFIKVGESSDWSKISSKNQNTLAIKTNGTLWGWGTNFSGELGLGNVTTYSRPVQIGILTNWFDAQAGTDHSIFISEL